MNVNVVLLDMLMYDQLNPFRIGTGRYSVVLQPRSGDTSFVPINIKWGLEEAIYFPFILLQLLKLKINKCKICIAIAVWHYSCISDEQHT
jgi:hypothetical protein